MKKLIYRKEKLENGLTVVALRHGSAPRVFLQVMYGVGSSHELPGEYGFAHLVEHMIFKGTEKLSEVDISETARKYGASFNAFTSLEVTGYYFDCDSSNWEPFVEILSDCMASARFDDQHLASELGAVIQELRGGLDHPEEIAFWDAMKMLLPAGHPYSRPVIGYVEDIASATGEKLRRFYKRNYRPDNAILTMIGDLDPDKAIDIARKYFGEVAQREKPDFIPEVIDVDPIGDLHSKLSVIAADVERDSLQISWLVPKMSIEGIAKTEVLSSYLMSGQGSKIYRRLVDENAVAVNVGASNYLFKHAGVSMLSVLPKPGELDKCKELAVEEIEKLSAGEIDEGDLEAAKKSIELDIAQTRERLYWLAGAISERFLLLGKDYDPDEDLDAIRRVTKEEVVDAAKKLLSPKSAAATVIRPLASEEDRKIWQAAREKYDKLIQEYTSKYRRQAGLEASKFADSLPSPRPVEFSSPEPELDEMVNGVRVVFRKNSDVPLVSAVIAFEDGWFLSKALEGTRYDITLSTTLEQSKWASKLEHLRFLREKAARVSFGIGGVSITAPSSTFGEVAEYVVRILGEPSFEGDDVRRVAKIFSEGIVRSMDDAGTVSWRAAMEEVYRDHPFGWELPEAQVLADSTSAENCRDAMGKLMRTAGIRVTISGDTDAETAKRIAGRLAEYLNGEYESQVEEHSPDGFTPSRRHVEMLRNQAYIVMVRPSASSVNSKKYVIDRLLSIPMFAPLGSRIYALRERYGIFYRATGSFAGATTRIHGVDYVEAVVPYDKADETVELLKKEIARMAAEPITEEELEKARKTISNDLIMQFATNGGTVSAYERAFAVGAGYDYFDKIRETVQQLTLDEVRSRAAELADPETYSVITVGRSAEKKE